MTPSAFLGSVTCGVGERPQRGSARLRPGRSSPGGGAGGQRIRSPAQVRPPGSPHGLASAHHGLGAAFAVLALGQLHARRGKPRAVDRDLERVHHGHHEPRRRSGAPGSRWRPHQLAGRPGRRHVLEVALGLAEREPRRVADRSGAGAGATGPVRRSRSLAGSARLPTIRAPLVRPLGSRRKRSTRSSRSLGQVWFSPASHAAALTSFMLFSAAVARDGAFTPTRVAGRQQRVGGPRLDVIAAGLLL